MEGRHIVFVASPLISAGGVYNFLCQIADSLAGEGVKCSLVYGNRSIAPAPTVDGSTVSIKHTGLALNIRGIRRGLRSITREQSADAIVSLVPQSDVACATLSRGHRYRWVAMVHGRPVPGTGEASGLRTFLWRRAVRWALRRCVGVVTVSEALGQELVDLDLVGDSRALSVVHNGVQAGRARPTIRSGLRKVAFLGRLSYEKGPDVFLRIVESIGVDARMYGTGPLWEECANRAASIGVEMMGWRPKEEALDWADIVIIPSRREGIPLALLESAAHGIVAIAQETGGTPEVLGDSALLRTYALHSEDVEDIASWRNLLEPLLSNDALWLEVADLEQRTVRAHFNDGSQCRELLESILGFVDGRLKGVPW